jgi:hypothetical protein
VLGAGSSSPGCRGLNQCRIFSGPQLGCCRRAAQIAVATSAAIRCGQTDWERDLYSMVELCERPLQRPGARVARSRPERER